MITWYLILAVVVTLVRGETDYCKICEPLGSHTACIFPKPGPGKNCTRYSSSPLTAEEKEKILDLHNRLRSKVARGQGWTVNSTFDAQPKAADMRQLYWDDELELIAQRWVDQCLPFYTTTPHDHCRDSNRFPVGQNIVTSAYSQPVPSDVEGRTMDWYNEIKDFDPRWVSRYTQNTNPDPSKQTGHYTQLVWGWTYLLGCARAVFEEEFEGSKWSVERIVCNYAPSGNFLTYPVYRIGEPCSKCPPGTQCSTKYTGLCARKSEQQDGNNNSSDESDEINSLRQVKSTVLPPVTWQYWTPGKFWVVPDHLSQSPQEVEASTSAMASSTPTTLDNLIDASSTPVTSSTPTSLDNLITASSRADNSPSPSITSVQPENSFPSSSPRPSPTQRPEPSPNPPVQRPRDPLRDFILQFNSIPLFNNSKFTSVSWIQLPNLPPKTLLELLRASPSFSMDSLSSFPSTQIASPQKLSQELLPPFQSQRQVSSDSSLRENSPFPSASSSPESAEETSSVSVSSPSSLESSEESDSTE